MRGILTSISIIVGVALGAAVVGVLGAYVVLPKVAPSVEADASAPDSTRRVASASDSTASRAAGGAPGRMDTTSRERSNPGAASDSSARQLQALRDSIDALNRRLQTVQETADTLRSRLADADAEKEKVNELGDALMEMRRRNLGNLLKDVDMGVLRKLYQETSGQARTRLLQSMTPKQAAQFVNQVVEETPPSTSRSEPGS